MKVCLDTNVLVQLFGSRRKFTPILDALVDGRLELAVSNEILLEYEETITTLSDSPRAQKQPRGRVDRPSAVWQAHARPTDRSGTGRRIH